MYSYLVPQKSKNNFNLNYFQNFQTQPRLQRLFFFDTQPNIKPLCFRTKHLAIPKTEIAKNQNVNKYYTIIHKCKRFRSKVGLGEKSKYGLLIQFLVYEHLLIYSFNPFNILIHPFKFIYRLYFRREPSTFSRFLANFLT